jgi:hypothetical protein
VASAMFLDSVSSYASAVSHLSSDQNKMCIIVTAVLHICTHQPMTYNSGAIEPFWLVSQV